VNWIDPLGFSANDVQTLINVYQNSVIEMVKRGERFPGKGPWRGRWNDLRWHKYPWGKKYKSCNEQADQVKSEMDGRKYDARWKFEVIRIDGVMGFALLATSSDPSDPAILFNPWEDAITLNPGGNPSDPFGVNSAMNGPE
jgi:hypothetical protein